MNGLATHEVEFADADGVTVALITVLEPDLESAEATGLKARGQTPKKRDRKPKPLWSLAVTARVRDPRRGQHYSTGQDQCAFRI
jgi:hypothetical protein